MTAAGRAGAGGWAAGRGRRGLTVALVVLGVGAAALGLRCGPGGFDLLARGYVNHDRPASIDAHNSPAAAADPGDPSVVVAADRIDTPKPSCSVSISTDGGGRWRPVALPLPAGAGNCFWPDVTWTGRGEALVLFGSVGGANLQPQGTWVQRLAGGRAAGAPVLLTGQGAFHPRLAAAGDLVVATWVRTGDATQARTLGLAPEPNPLVAAVSRDGGRSFGAPVQVGDPSLRLVTPSVVAGTDGTIVVTALDLGDDQADYSGLHHAAGGPPEPGRWRVLAWSGRGEGFAGPAVVAEVDIPQRIHVDLGTPRPGLARDARSGRVYATWESGRGTARDVFLARSDDGGRTWSRPTRVARPGTQTMPAVDAAPDGRVDLVFYDRGGDRKDAMAEVVHLSSWDGGRHFTEAVASARPLDTGIGLGSFQGLAVLGTQLDVIPGADRSVVLWSDTARATMDDNRQDLGVAVLGVHRPRQRRPALVAAGAGALLAGLALAARRPRR